MFSQIFASSFFLCCLCKRCCLWQLQFEACNSHSEALCLAFIIPPEIIPRILHALALRSASLQTQTIFDGLELCRPLLEGDVEMEHISEELWNAPFMLLTHEMPDPENAEGSTEPLFSYANKACLYVFLISMKLNLHKLQNLTSDPSCLEDISTNLLIRVM